MTTITIIIIVVIALLTIIIFGLTWLAYASCIKAYKIEVDHGKYDNEIFHQYYIKKQHRIRNRMGFVGSYVILSVLLALFVTGIIYRARGENFIFNNQTALVIKSGSMSDFYDDKLAEQYREYNYDPNLHFDIGDICIFETISENSELVEGEVYGYTYKNIIITHRLIKIHDESMYEFRGDNNPISDGMINRDRIVYHYVGNKIQGIGTFVLYAQSYFGLWSLMGVMGVAVGSEIVCHKIGNIEKKRLGVLKNET